MAKTSPTQRTLQRLRKDESVTLAGVVEHWNPHAKIRQDLFGFADVIAIRRWEPHTLLVQATTISNQAAHVKKLLALEAVETAVRSSIRVEVWGWVKRANGRWEVVRTEFGIKITKAHPWPGILVAKKIDPDIEDAVPEHDEPITETVPKQHNLFGEEEPPNV